MASFGFMEMLMIVLGGGGANSLLDLMPTEAYWKAKSVTVSVARLVNELDPDAAPAAKPADIPKLIRDLGAGDGPEVRRAAAFLVAAQSDDGGWGGAPGVAASVEETALAVEALSGWFDHAGVRDACVRGGEYLAERILSAEIDSQAPIGLYFTKLWYSEKLYPLIWSTGALARLLAALAGRPDRRASPTCMGAIS